MRRLPIFLVIDISESMVGDNLRHLHDCLERLVRRLRQDPYALESVHLSIVAFAGAAGTLVPLTELMSFYQPRLPVGSGTSIGVALHHLMDEINRHVKFSQADQKGDWKPLVYFISDGTPTDDPTSAIERWQQQFAMKAKLINIGISTSANVATLSSIAELTFKVEDENWTDAFRYLSECLEDSIKTQSRSVGIDVPVTLSKEMLENPAVSLVKAPDNTLIDENFAIFTGLCRQVRLPYLMKFERLNTPLDLAYFRYVGVYPAEKDYETWSDNRPNNRKVSSSQLIGGGGCPHCGSAIGMAVCDCGQIFCLDQEGEVECPTCHKLCFMSSGDGSDDSDFDIQRSRG